MRLPICLLALAPSLAACARSRSPADAPSPVGGPCGASRTCAPELACILDPRFLDGYCSRTCEDGRCPEGASCATGFSPPLCLALCTVPGDCREGYRCWAGACRPPCLADAECGAAGARCVLGECEGPECATPSDCPPSMRCESGRCVPAPPPPPDAGPERRGIGEPCADDADCASGHCLPALLGGTCTARCARRRDCLAEVGDVPCSPVATSAGLATLCVPPLRSGNFLAGACSSDADCESRACHQGQCIEACVEDADCLLGQRCREIAVRGGGRYRGCGYAARGAAVEVVDVDLGRVTLTSGFDSRRIVFGVPPDAVSVTLVARQTSGDSLPLSFVDVYDPANAVLFDYAALLAWTDQPIRWLPVRSHEAIAMLVPNSTPDRVAFRHGRYGFTVAMLGPDPGSGELRLSARIKRAEGADVTGGTLDLRVWLVDVGLTAASARTDARLQDALRELGAILRPAAIAVGDVDYVQVTGAEASALRVIDSSDGPTSELARLFRLSARAEGERLNVFLVRSIAPEAAEGGIALGIAGGIPGPPGLHGTMHSGIVVAFDRAVVGSDARVVAQVMAHEIGHYLGLFHVREQLAPCPAGTGPTESRPCAPFGGEDVLADTSRSSGNNLMWWALGGADGRTYNVALSEGQRFVLRRSALVR